MYKAKQRMKTLLLACFAALVSMLLAVALWVTPTGKISASAEDTTIEFTLGANGSASHNDGSSKTSYSETVEGYTLNITGGTNMYTGARDAKGNSCIKLGASKKTGGFSFTVPDDVSAAIISVSGYKTSTVTAKANDTSTAIKTTSDTGTYTDITVDTTSNKTVTFTTTSTGYRAMVNTITYVIAGSEPDTPTCEHEDYETPWVYDSETKEHYQQCVNCETEIEGTRTTCSDFTYGKYTTADGKHTRTATCIVCGGEQTETGDCEVSTSEYVRVGNKHSKTGTCSICGDSTTVEEDCTLSYENVSNENGTHNMTSTCSVCEKSVTTENVDCTFGEGVLDGTTLTYTCEYCEYSYTEEATMHTVTYDVPNGFPTVESVEVADGYTTTLLKADDYQQYTFVGWVIEKLAEDTATAPEYLKEGAEYTVNADVTLYALYSYSNGMAEETWNLVTDAATLAVGKEIVIVASGSNYAMGEDNGNNRTAVNVTKRSDKSTIELTDTIQVITLEAGTVDDTFAFNVGDGYLYAASSSSNYLKTKATLDNNGSWSITVDSEGIATIKAQGTYTRNWLRKNSNSTLFACYSSGQSDISIYMKSGGKATCYTTTVDVTCDHAYQESVTAPTCTDNGFTTYTCSICGNSYIANEVEATGHSYEESITKAATCTEAGIKTFTCSVCADTYTEVIPALGHNFVDGTCDNCGEAQPIKATLTFDDTSKRTSLTNDQQVWKENGITVTNNKASSTNNVANYSNPVRFYKSSTVIIEWTGMKVIVLNSASGEYATNLAASLTEGTVTENGTVFTIVLDEAKDSYTFTCANGQVRLNSISVYSQDAHIDSASITIGEDITMNYYVTMPDIFASAAMYFTVKDITEPIIAESKLAADGRYVFSLDIPPQFMATNIRAELKLGEQILATQENYSVKAYAQNMLNNSPSDKLKQLLTDLLYYGDAAYNYANETTDETPVTNDVENIGTASTAAPATTDFKLENMLEENATYPAYFLGAGVYFDNVNKIYVKLSTTENVTLTINGVAVEVTGDTVYTDGILATGFAETYTFVLSCNGEEMQILTYSVNAYVYAMKDKGNAMAALAIALYNYGESAKAYKA